jgi:hypothetical protein
VDKDSATLRLSNETLLPIAADHCEMCRFADETDQAYKIVVDALDALVHDRRKSRKSTDLGFCKFPLS